MKTCCFTGHRTQKMNSAYDKTEFFEKLKKQTRDEIVKAIENDYKTFYIGMALGFDMLVGEIILELKKEFDIKLICAIPCPNQDRYWGEKDKEKYKYILKYADEVVYVSDKYFTGCMQKRNKFMVDNSSLLIAYYNGTLGGTKQTIDYAMNKNKEIIIINV